MDLKKLERSYQPNKGSTKTHITFTTDSGIDYFMYVITANRMIPGFAFSNKLLFLDFHPLNPLPISDKKEMRKLDEIEKISDDKIMNTVVNFIFDLVHDKNAVIVFISSDEDGRREKRTKLFNMVYIRHLKKEFHKIDYVFPVIGKLSLLFRRDNEHAASLCMATSEQMIENLNEQRKRRASI